jgi:hypothetical protein
MTNKSKTKTGKPAPAKRKVHKNKPVMDHARTTKPTPLSRPATSSGDGAGNVAASPAEAAVTQAQDQSQAPSETSSGEQDEEETSGQGGVVTAVGLHDFTEYNPLVEMDLPYLVARRQELSKLLEEGEKEKKELGERILAAMVASGLEPEKQIDKKGKTVWVGKKVTCLGNVVSTVSTRTPSVLLETLLMEKGVPPSVIQECTVPGLRYTQVRVSKAK